MINRQMQLLELLMAEERVQVSRLVDVLGVSQVTVRKDLDALVARGLVRCEHGVASLCSQDDPNNRLAYHYQEKTRIAQLAARSVADGETVMIGSGSCCTLLAEALAALKQNVTIVTNSAFIASHLRGKGTANIVLLGGVFQQEAQALVGPLVQRCVESLHVGKLFIGMDGFDGEQGFMGGDLMRAEAERAMAARADRTVVLAESEKFLRQGAVPLLPVKAIHSIYTDHEMPVALSAQLGAMGILIFRTPKEEGARY